MGLAFCSFFVGASLVKEAVLSNDSLVGSISFAWNSGVEHTCLALWIWLWITDNFAEMGWLDL